VQVGLVVVKGLWRPGDYRPFVHKRNATHCQAREHEVAIRISQ
jgi:hypothetical protein